MTHRQSPLPKGPLKVVRPLGGGGMADVFLAVDASGQQFALKRIRATSAEDPDLLQQFRREAQISSVLHHPNIVGLYEHGSDAAGPYLLLEYVEGTTAAALVRSAAVRHEQLPVEVVISIARDVAAALRYAHSLRHETCPDGVIHRDISPDNVLITKTGVSKLSDFGIAKVIGGTVLTRSGNLKGKLGYLAAELLSGEEADPLTDIYAFGVTLFRLLTGVMPYSGRNEGEIFNAILSGQPAELRLLRADVPPVLLDFVTRAIGRARFARPTLEELSAALDAPELSSGGSLALAAAVRRQLSASGAEVSAALAPEPERRGTLTAARVPARPPRRWPVVALLGALPVVAGALWLSLRSQPAPQVVAPVVTAPLVMAPPPAAAPAVVETPVAAPPPPPPPVVDTEALAAVEAPAPKPSPKARVVKRKEATAPRRAAPLPVAPAVARAEQPTTGKVAVKVRPWGDVFIDGMPKGRTPLGALDLAPGEHTVLVTNSELKAERRQRVSVEAGQEHELKFLLDEP